MKQYYKTIKRIGDTTNIAYWCGDNERAEGFFTKSSFDFVIPYGAKKPSNVPLDYFNQI